MYSVTHGQSQTRTAQNITVNWNLASWVDKSPTSFAANDNKYAYTKKTSGQLPLFFDHFGFNLPEDATITRIVSTVRKFKSGKSEVKDLDGVTWFLVRSDCSFTPDCNTNYGPTMSDPNAWSSKEAMVNYEQAGAGTYTRSITNSDGTKTVVTESFAWTPEMINDRMFGFTFNPTINIKGGGAAIYIDQLSITVHYSSPSEASAITTTRNHEIQLKQHNRSVLVSAVTRGRYLLTVTDRSGNILQKELLNNPLQQHITLHSRVKGYIIVSVEGMGTRKSLQTYIE